MLTILSNLAKGAALLLAFCACLLFIQAVPEAKRVQADRLAVDECYAARTLLMARIPPSYPAWRRERMLQELPDCTSLPRVVWRTRRAAASGWLFGAALLAAAFAAVATAADRAAARVET
ncbi:hypothetical protein [Plastoroseomonas hellenica]|uniref:hypothetical protein n=1 Tax=Plastoroseomonas hellenica TaxID=2687306 RepID=UPI001BAB0DE0|nr:hypothetical protein [Plastoroseomonas hellenica]MBR0646852.1 hypothetical protein [Plastoroseomonas hellenica]